jgi:hypothetical protein
LHDGEVVFSGEKGEILGVLFDLNMTMFDRHKIFNISWFVVIPKPHCLKSDKLNNKIQEGGAPPLNPPRKMQVVIRASRSQSRSKMHEQKPRNRIRARHCYLIRNSLVHFDWAYPFGYFTHRALRQGAQCRPRG